MGQSKSGLALQAGRIDPLKLEAVLEQLPLWEARRVGRRGSHAVLQDSLHESVSVCLGVGVWMCVCPEPSKSGQTLQARQIDPSKLEAVL